MASLAHVTHAAVLSAVARFDELGASAFFARYGYGPSRSYHLRLRGRSYPSKAILGVAAGLSSTELFGGVAQVLAVFKRLNLEVRKGSRLAVEPAVALAAQAVAADWDRAAPTPLSELPANLVAYCASGSNRPGEIRGLAAIGHDIGVAVDELKEDAILELLRLLGSDVVVFVDSGAFSEVKFPGGVPTVVAPISHDEWLERLAIYRRLAVVLGNQLMIVAPDKVGFQAETLERLTRYREQVAELVALGARVLMPVQKGELSQAEMFAAALEIVPGMIPALPCKKAATTVDEAREFAAAAKPTHIHLLGVGVYGRASKRAGTFLEAIAASSPATSVSCDSCWIRGNVGDDKPGGRLYTRARRAVTAAFGYVVAKGKRLATGPARNVAAAALVVAFGG